MFLQIYGDFRFSAGTEQKDSVCQFNESVVVKLQVIGPGSEGFCFRS